MVETLEFLRALKNITEGISEVIKSLAPSDEEVEYNCILSGQAFLFRPLQDAVRRGWFRQQESVRLISKIENWSDNLRSESTTTSSFQHDSNPGIDLKNAVAIGAARWAASPHDAVSEQVSEFGVRGCFGIIDGSFCLKRGVFTKIFKIQDLPRDTEILVGNTAELYPLWERTADTDGDYPIVKGMFIAFRPTGFDNDKILSASNAIIDVCIRLVFHSIYRQIVDGKEVKTNHVGALYHPDVAPQMFASVSDTSKSGETVSIEGRVVFGPNTKIRCPYGGTLVVFECEDGQERHIELREIGAWGG